MSCESKGTHLPIISFNTISAESPLTGKGVSFHISQLLNDYAHAYRETPGVKMIAREKSEANLTKNTKERRQKRLLIAMRVVKIEKETSSPDGLLAQPIAFMTVFAYSQSLPLIK